MENTLELTNDKLINKLFDLTKIFEQQLTSIKEHNQEIKEVNKRLTYLEEEQPVNPMKIAYIAHLRKMHVIKLLGGKEAPAYKNRDLTSAVYRQAANDFKKHFKIPRYDLLKQSDEKAGYEFWINWVPSPKLRTAIAELNADYTNNVSKK